MKFKIKFTEYLERAFNLLQYDDNINLTYCSLELRRAIELIIWTQFIDVFRNKITQAGMYHFDYPFKLQNQSISKMYDLLKTHINNYAAEASRGRITTHLSATGSGPNIKNGDVCYIPPELPTSDYRYLSFIIHYEKEIDPKEYQPDKKLLTEIYNRLIYVKEHYTYRFLTINKNEDKVIENIKNSFGLTDKSFRTFS